MNERAKAFREIAEALLDQKNGPHGSCCGCRNIGDDAIIFLRDLFPDDLPYIRDNVQEWDRKAWIDGGEKGTA